MIVISPFDKLGPGPWGGYVSHLQYDNTSPLRLIEDNWGPAPAHGG